MQPLHRQLNINEIAARIKSSCDESIRFRNVVKIGELIKISPLLKLYRDADTFC